MQFGYTVDRTGAYVAPASMVLAQSAVLEGESLFPDIRDHLLRCYPVAFNPVLPTATLGLPADLYPIGQAPERRDRHMKKEVEDGGVNLDNFNFSFG